MRKPYTPSLRTLAAATAIAAVLGVSMAAMANESPEWHPESSERLVKLPANYMKKSLDRDFAESALGSALQGANDEIGAKAKTLTDLQSAIGKANGEMQMELRHQFLHEKRQYVDMMSRRNDLQRKHVQIQTRLFEDMLARMRPFAGSESPMRVELIKRQEAARSRFESSLASVDMRLFNTTSAPESKYSVKYAENSSAIEQLVGRINTHKMNETTLGEGETMTKEDYVRQMLADAQAESAVIDQEDTILGYMARLVALDALALADEALDPGMGDSLAMDKSGPAAVTPLFISN